MVFNQLQVGDRLESEKIHERFTPVEETPNSVGGYARQSRDSRELECRGAVMIGRPATAAEGIEQLGRP
jgi:hypothetical protein